ncbi:ATP-binding protein [Kitasatospora sp. NPDC101235]|uniref:ATP-binding protein n=1 Tax=Kitasatospora sp. NPDC101235 TaxID=3364101 RepID=UPI00380C04F3
MSTHLIVGPTGSGKSHTLQQLIAQAATDPATTTWAITPRSELTAADRHTTPDGAEQMLTHALAIVDQRNATLRDARQRAHQPTPTAPRIRLLIDEAEHLLRHEPLAEQLHRLVTTGRPAAVETVVAVSDLRLNLWPLDLRDHYLAGTVTQLHRGARAVPGIHALTDTQN